MAAFLDSELTVVKNAEGIPTALGYPILLNQNSPLFNGVGGGKKKAKDAHAKLDTEPDYANLAIPAGLVCTTQTICRRPEMFNPIETDEIVPESLYDKLLALAEEQSSSARSSQQPSASNKQPSAARKKTKKAKTQPKRKQTRRK